MLLHFLHKKEEKYSKLGQNIWRIFNVIQFEMPTYIQASVEKLINLVSEPWRIWMWSICLVLNLRCIIVPRELWMPSRRQVGVHDFQSSLGICSNWRQDSRSQFYNSDTCVRPTPNFMQPSPYWVCSSFLIFNYLYLSDWRLKVNVGKQLSQAKLFRLPAPWISWRQARVIGFKFFI